MNKAHDFQKYIPYSLAIGDDEGENAFIYTNGKKGFGIYAVAFNNFELDDMIYIKISYRITDIRNRGGNSSGLIATVIIYLQSLKTIGRWKFITSISKHNERQEHIICVIFWNYVPYA